MLMSLAEAGVPQLNSAPCNPMFLSPSIKLEHSQMKWELFYIYLQEPYFPKIGGGGGVTEQICLNDKFTAKYILW